MNWERMCAMGDGQQAQSPCKWRRSALPLNDGGFGAACCIKAAPPIMICHFLRSLSVKALGRIELPGDSGVPVVGGHMREALAGYPSVDLVEVVDVYEGKDFVFLYNWARDYTRRGVPYYVVQKGTASFGLVKRRRV